MFSASDGDSREELVTFDLINCLYVFVLAGFIGFEVIRRVSRCCTRR